MDPLKLKKIWAEIVHASLKIEQFTPLQNLKLGQNLTYITEIYYRDFAAFQQMKMYVRQTN